MTSAGLAAAVSLTADALKMASLHEEGLDFVKVPASQDCVEQCALETQRDTEPEQPCQCSLSFLSKLFAAIPDRVEQSNLYHFFQPVLSVHGSILHAESKLSR